MTEIVNGKANVAVDAADLAVVSNGLSNVTNELDSLKNTVENLPPTGLQSITEGGTNIVNNALTIFTSQADEVSIGVNKNMFLPFDFSALTNVND